MKILLAVFTLALLAVARSWHAADQRPPTFDDAWFLETSLHFHRSLTAGGIVDFLSAWASSFRTKAPLMSALPLPFYLLLGVRPQSAILVNFVFLIITNIYLFLLGRRLFSAGVGLAAVVFYQTMPLAYGVSRVFLPDYGLAALVVVWLYYLTASERFQDGRIVVLLGILLGLGLLMKVLFPLYIGGPLAAALLARRSLRPLLVMAAPALVLAATWYPFHLPVIFRYAWQAGYGGIGELYSGPGFAAWFYQVINQGISFWYAAAAVLGCLGACLGALAAGRFRIEWNERAWLLAGWVALPVLALALGRNREIRLLLPALPGVALLLAASLFAAARRPRIQAALCALAALAPLRLYAASNFQGGHDHPVTLGPFVVFSRDLGWARPPDNAGRWEQHRVLEALQRLGRPSLRARYVVVGAEHPFFNANLFQYLNGYTRYPLLFNSLGYAEASADRAVERIYALDARFLVMAEGFHSPDLVETFNRVNQEVQARLDRGQLPFRLRARVALGHRIRAAIYEREAPWTRVSTAPSRPLEVDFDGGLRLLGYDLVRRDRHLTELACYWTAPRGVAEDFRVHIEFHRAGALLFAQDHFLTGGERPPFDWQPGEVIRQSLLLYLPGSDPVEARLWLAAWGIGDPQPILSPAGFGEGVVPLRLDP